MVWDYHVQNTPSVLSKIFHEYKILISFEPRLILQSKNKAYKFRLLFSRTLPKTQAIFSVLPSFVEIRHSKSKNLNRGRNLELINETSKFQPLFLCWKLRIQANFSMLPSSAEMGHPKRKVEKSECKNENGSNPNPEFSFFTLMGGYLFCQWTEVEIWNS